MATFPPQVEQWRAGLERVAADLPIGFLLKWLLMESFGNPCATGVPGVEAGIFQTWHPHDDRYGATFAELRAACAGGQVQARPLTSAEIDKQLSGVGLVRNAVATARARLARVGAQWPESSTDFWSMVKQEHALPAVGDLLPLVASKLGRPPQSWSEFRAQVEQLTPGEITAANPALFVYAVPGSSHHGLVNRIADTMQNAEEAGAYGSAVSLAALATPTNLAKVAVLAVGIWGLAQIMKAHRR